MRADRRPYSARSIASDAIYSPTISGNASTGRRRDNAIFEPLLVLRNIENNLSKSSLGLESGLLLKLLSIRDTTLHIFESSFVGAGVRNKDDG
jgi:hypothetical protein